MFNEVFWDAEFDMMGLLREPVGDENKQSSYELKRGERIAAILAYSPLTFS